MSRWKLSSLFAVLVLCAHSLAQADSYIAVAAGGMLGDLDTTDRGSLELKNSLVFGGKLGYFFDDRNYNWFGVEADLYRARPKIPESGGVPGADFQVHSLGINGLVRFPGYRLEPHIGMGVGLNLGNISEGPFRAEGAFAPSFNLIFGTRYYLTRKTALLVEYKYNLAQFNFTRNDLTADYRAHILMVGVAFHFFR